MPQSVLEKRFAHRAVQETPAVAPAPTPTVHSALAALAQARQAISEAREGWPEFCDYSDAKAASLAELARQRGEIEDNRKVIAGLRHEIEDLRLDREHELERVKADKTVAQNDLARWRAAAERKGGGW